MMRSKKSDIEDYFRLGARVSRRGDALLLRGAGWGRKLVALVAAGALAGAPGVGVAQYPGKITKAEKPAATLRSIAVLEWVGEPGKPSASRLVPIAVYDGQQLNDGAIYLNRPEPLALAGGTEYELQADGKATRLFDVFGSSEVLGSWQGVGAVKPLPLADAQKAAGAFNTSSLMNGGRGDDAPEDDKPVLKRKHPKDSDSENGGAGKGDSKSSDEPALKRKSDDSSASGSGDAAKTGSGGDDPDRPTLKRKSGADSGSSTTSQTGSQSGSTGASSSGQGSSSVDPDRPTIRRPRKSNEVGMMETSNEAPDPDRPRLKHGKPADLDRTEAPHLDGLPPNLQQAVAVSDATSRAEHPWKYTWANAEDELKMKQSLEAIARTALGMDAPAAPAKPVKRTPAKTAAAAKPGTAAAPAKKSSMLHKDVAAEAEPAELAEEHFGVFELTYGATATLVLTAASPKPDVAEDASQGDEKTKLQADETPVIKRGKPAQTAVRPVQGAAKPGSSAGKAKAKPAPAAAKAGPQKFVTLIAQPDLYGGIVVLYKSVTDAAHLDQTPRMRLVDAVDAMGDNRGELLFELRGSGQRQFALYRILRGSAEQLFATVAQP